MGRRRATAVLLAVVVLGTSLAILAPAAGATPFSTPITGTVFNDLDRDGVQDPGEPGLPNVNLAIYHRAVTTTTDADGNYVLDPQEIGYFTIYLSGNGLAATPVPTTPAEVAVQTTEAGVHDIDFGYRAWETGSVSGVVWNDLDGDGVREPGEPGLEAIQVNAFGGPGGNGGSGRFTAADGSYTLPISMEGNYDVWTPHTFGWTATTPNPHNLDVIGEDVTGIDFGLWDPSAPNYPVSGTVWNDVDGDGEQDAGEPGLADWPVVAFGGPGGNGGDSTHTNGDGTYTVHVHAVGNYEVYPVASGWIATTPYPRNVDVDTAGVTGVDHGLRNPSAGPHATEIGLGGASEGQVGDVVTLSADLGDADDDGSPIVGADVEFTIGTQTCTGITDEAGHTECTITLDQPAGDTTVEVEYAGDDAHEPAHAEDDFTITAEPTEMTYTGEPNVATGGPATLSGALTDDDGDPVADAEVTLTLGEGDSAQPCTATTDDDGDAACTITAVDQPLGPDTVTVTFAGDDRRQPSTTTAETLVFSFAGGGQFVVGDRTVGDPASAVGRNVNFWGSQWSRNNSLSGGGAPAAFKGFQNDPDPVACGESWSSRPGNSSNPPGRVPEYLGVIVSSRITKSGPISTGDTVHVVVVRTGPGYAGNPGHPGNGEIVAVVC
jgi:hypothetical protein